MRIDWQIDVWAGFAFDYPFSYNGVENLIIEYRWQGDDNNSVYVYGYNTVGNRAVHATTATAPTGTPRNYMPRLRIFYTVVGIAEERTLTVQRGAKASFGQDLASSVLFDVLGRRTAAASTGVYFLVRPDGGRTKAVIVR